MILAKSDRKSADVFDVAKELFLLGPHEAPSAELVARIRRVFKENPAMERTARDAFREEFHEPDKMGTARNASQVAWVLGTDLACRLDVAMALGFAIPTRPSMSPAEAFGALDESRKFAELKAKSKAGPR